MSNDETSLTDRATLLRQTFDRSFAEPVENDRPATTDFISIRLGDGPHALRMTEIAGLRAGIRVTPVPSPLRELLGIAGFRGVLTPVYDLAALLGYPASAGGWMVLDSTRSLALAFDGFEEHFRLEHGAVAAPLETPGSPHLHELARRGDRAWPIIDIPSLVAAIRSRAAAFHKEH